MALQDLKSNLSNYRKPKVKVSLSQRVTPAPESFTTTPLSDKVESLATKPGKIEQTPTKVGTTPTKVKQGDKFKGETKPTPMSLEERFLGQTTPTEVNQTEKFKGETTPNKVNQTEKFKGETTPNSFDGSSNFLGETTPKSFDISSNFLGETTPNAFDLSSNFLGETTPNNFDMSSNFLGETTPNAFGFNPNLESQGKEPGLVDFITNRDASGFTLDQFHKAPSLFSGVTSQEAGNSVFNSVSSQYSNLGRADYFGNIHADGFTLSQFHKAPSRFLGITNNGENYSYDNSISLMTQLEYGFTGPGNGQQEIAANFFGNQNHIGFITGRFHKDKSRYMGVEQGGAGFGGDYVHTGPTEIGQTGTFEVPAVVDYFDQNQVHSLGFTAKQFHKAPSQFISVNATGDEYSTTSLLDGYLNAYVGLSFQAGRGQYQVGPVTGDTPRYSPIGDKYQNENGELSYPSIAELMEQRQSPSFLDQMYTKYNLQDPEANRFSLVPQPYVLRGIQRADNPEPQTWGFGVPIDDGLIRGGAATSTERAGLDLVRLGSFFASSKGAIWSLTQVGLQRSNKFNRIWTPANFLAAVGGQHLGFKPDRSGLLGLDKTGRYQKVLGNKFKDKLEIIYTDIPMQSQATGPFPTQVLSGGIDSVYGIGVTNTSRFVNTFSAGFINRTADPSLTMDKMNPYSPFTINGKFIIGDTKHLTTYKQAFTDASAIDFGQPDSLSEFGVTTPVDGKTLIDGIEQENLIGDNKKNLYSSQGSAPGLNNDIADYNMLTYQNIQELAKDRNDNGTTLDFRSKQSATRGSENAKTVNYTTNNIENPTLGFGFGNPGKMLTDAGTLRTDQFSQKYEDKKVYESHYDKITASPIGIQETAKAGETLPDIVPLIFKLGTEKSRLQFRGTISGLTENFSPSYNEIKYSGRAEPVYVYDSFKRDISFNFKVYATSRVEMQPMWSKLERLSTYTMPRYASTGYTSPGNDNTDSFLRLTIGSLYKDTPSILTSLSYTYSDETPWDIDFGTPMGIDISVGCTILGNELHQYDSQKVFVFDGNGKSFSSSGLTSPAKTGEFRTPFTE